MKTRLVTALYFGIHQHPFYGHDAPARWDRYINSLETLSTMNEEIICYCNEQYYDNIISEFETREITNIELRVKNLEDIKHSSRMIDIKTKNPDKFKFYLEIGWAKIALMEECMSDDLDYLYWIDVGLSHMALFPKKYNPNADKITGISYDKNRYTYYGIFNSSLFPNINKFLGDKLIDLRNTTFFHNHRESNEILEKAHIYPSLSVGGIIGGHTSKLKTFFNRFEEYCQVCLNKEFLINHEMIMTVIGHENPEDYMRFEFNTWYHENTKDTDPSVTDEFLSNKKSFYKFFEEIGQ